MALVENGYVSGRVGLVMGFEVARNKVNKKASIIIGLPHPQRVCSRLDGLWFEDGWLSTHPCRATMARFFSSSLVSFENCATHFTTSRRTYKMPFYSKFALVRSKALRFLAEYFKRYRAAQHTEATTSGKVNRSCCSSARDAAIKFIVLPVPFYTTSRSIEKPMNYHRYGPFCRSKSEREVEINNNNNYNSHTTIFQLAHTCVAFAWNEITAIKQCTEESITHVGAGKRMLLSSCSRSLTIDGETGELRKARQNCTRRCSRGGPGWVFSESFRILCLWFRACMTNPAPSRKG